MNEEFIDRNELWASFCYGKERIWRFVSDKDSLWTIDKNYLLAEIVDRWKNNETISVPYVVKVRDLIWEWIGELGNANIEVICDGLLVDPPYGPEPSRMVYQISIEKQEEPQG